MNKIIKIHGCSGAGKTTFARALLDGSDSTYTIRNAAGKVEAYGCAFNAQDFSCVVLGSYENNCGGMDTVSTAAEAMKLVADYQKFNNVVHEGLLQSTYYGAMGTDSRQYGDSYIYAFLDTPLETCLERVVARREAAGSQNKFNPQLTRDKFVTIDRLRLRLPAMGHRVVVLDHKSPPLPQLLNLMRET